MERMVDLLMNNVYTASLASVAVAVFALIVFLACFELVARYKCWEEIKKGNVAVALATGGKIFGICNIFRFAFQTSDSIYQSLIWATYGFALLLGAYFLFEFLTPVFRIDEEIRADNRAVGVIAMIISVSLSYLIGATVI
ncbi:DUF350 domain-containing protein [Paenibacillus beijingensis]|uniref:Membrane protein n=1 Tax=Paenibacillus beijingensis TaxID=1126833 RepID=A0A0D5NQ98_9BACL|nr:DUF350 domain-containing protein [Paenibacillus beijingensis]AJY77436.1 membrane protein [Paenibacillus beijingensis]